MCSFKVYCVLIVVFVAVVCFAAGDYGCVVVYVTVWFDLHVLFFVGVDWLPILLLVFIMIIC